MSKAGLLRQQHLQRLSFLEQEANASGEVGEVLQVLLIEASGPAVTARHKQADGCTAQTPFSHLNL